MDIHYPHLPFATLTKIGGKMLNEMEQIFSCFNLNHHYTWMLITLLYEIHYHNDLQLHDDSYHLMPQVDVLVKFSWTLWSHRASSI